MVPSFTQLLEKKYADKLDADAKEYIRFVTEGSGRMYDLLNGLLAYSTVNIRGKSFQEVNLNMVVSKVINNLDPERLYIMRPDTMK